LNLDEVDDMDIVDFANSLVSITNKEKGEEIGVSPFKAQTTKTSRID
jgi:hypothetical protein